MTRAEIAAWEAYPDDRFISEEYSSMCRGFYQEGYEQAEKDTIERAVAWLKDYVKYFELYNEKGMEEFKKAMEEK